MNENPKPKGILAKYTKNSNFKYFLCPNCYEYLMFDECTECGLICEIDEDKHIDLQREKIRSLNNIAKFFENLFPLH